MRQGDAPLHDELAAAVERVLREQARRNRLTVANIRVFALVVVAALDYVYHLYPLATIGLSQFSVANAQLAAAWALVALAIMVLLRRGWYVQSLSWLLPILDGVIICSLFSTIFITTHTPAGGIDLHPVIVTAAVCTFLAGSSGLSLSRRAAILTTAMSVAIFAWVSFLIGYTFAQAAFVCGMILSAGLLALRMTAIVRRAVESETRRVILQRFLPASLVDADPGAALAMIAQPRQVEATVLVSDLRGFTAYAEHAPPGEVLAFLNRVQGGFAAAVREHGGTVDKFMGDGMLAVFGAPEALSGHAGRALAAARAMLALTATLNEERTLRGEPDIRVGIGIHTGEIIVGCLGSGARLELTIIGDAVNAASRLEGNTKDLGVDLLISEAAAILTGQLGVSSLLRPAGEFCLRGRQQPLKVFTLS